MLAACGAHAPAWLCSHLLLALYLLPSACLAVLIARLARLHPLFLVFTVAGTLCHELAHLLVGLLAGARPLALSILPRKVAGPQGRPYWQLGSVSFGRLRWYNAAPAALAPLLIVLLPFAVAGWRTRGGWQFGGLDLALALLLAPQWLSFWPSTVDWRLAARSWPYLLIMLAVAAALALWQPSLFQLVKK